jgi:dynein heavy chain 1
MLFSQGFKSAERLADKVVPLFELCSEQLSPQVHYDFGLRALKSVLLNAGFLKRRLVSQHGKPIESEMWEQGVLIRSINETVMPKLVS